MKSDPHELENLAADPENAGLVERFMAKVRARWDMAAFDAAVRESQARRWVVYPALRSGAYCNWEFQPQAAGLRAIYAQPHGPERARRAQAVSER